MSCNCDTCTCEKSNKKVVLMLPISNLDYLKEFEEVILRDDVLVKVVTDADFNTMINLDNDAVTALENLKQGIQILDDGEKK